jgi:hypothetical protein
MRASSPLSIALARMARSYSRLVGNRGLQSATLMTTLPKCLPVRW